jgi:DNA-binding NarL/FixJ family response regulator
MSTSNVTATSCSGSKTDATALQALTSRPDYASRVNDVVEQIADAADEIEAVELLSEATRRLGADVAAFATFIPGDGSDDSYRFLLACDALWCIEYEGRARYIDDPWLRYAMQHSEPARTSEIAVTTAHERNVVELAVQFGFRSAVVVPSPPGGRLTRIGVLCLGSKTPDYFEQDGYVALKVAARGLAMELHEWWVKRMRQELVDETGINAEDLALLQRERLGHGSKAIATDLNTTSAAVDTRFYRINQKLGVPNRRAAAVLAAEYGLI